MFGSECSKAAAEGREVEYVNLPPKPVCRIWRNSRTEQCPPEARPGRMGTNSNINTRLLEVFWNKLERVLLSCVRVGPVDLSECESIPLLYCPLFTLVNHWLWRAVQELLPLGTSAVWQPGPTGGEYWHSLHMGRRLPVVKEVGSTTQTLHSVW